jgi:hypothetical protein
LLTSPKNLPATYVVRSAARSHGRSPQAEGAASTNRRRLNPVETEEIAP